MKSVKPAAHGAVLALDLGSSSVRALVFKSGRVRDGALARRQVGIVHASGAAEVDADAYVAAIVACLDELLERRLLEDVVRVAVSTQWHSLAGLDRAGRLVTPVISWADTRAAVGDTRGPDDPVAYHSRTGAWHHRLYWSVRIPWLRGRVGTEAVQWAGLPEIVARLLLDDPSASVSSASGTGLLDIGRLEWDPEACALAAVDTAALPALAPADWTAHLAARWARRWPPLAGVPWSPFTGDGAASSVGVGCVDPSSVSATIGTSAAVRVVEPLGRVSSPPPLPFALWRYRVDHDRVVTGTAFTGAGNLYGWAREMFSLPHEPSLADELASVVPGKHGLTVLPFFAGSRPPATIPAGSGVVTGLAMCTRPVDVLAAVYEGVCLEMEQGLRTLEDILPAEPTVVLNGGAALASPWWQQAFAAAVGRPIVVSGHPEAGARGAAAVAVGASWPEPGFPVVPSPEAVAGMHGARDRYRALREALLPA